MEEKDFDPTTMQIATAEDVFRIWKRFYGSRPMKSKYGSFYSKRLGGFVYIAEDNDGNIKVGGTNNVQKRIQQLRLKYPSLKLLAKIPAKRFMELEKFIHYELEPYKVAREWYYCEDDSKIFTKIGNLVSKHGELFDVGYPIFEQ